MAITSWHETIPEIVPDKKIYSDYISGGDEKLQQFITRQESLHGEVILCTSIAEMADALADLLKPFGTSSSKYFQDELIDQIFQINPDIRNYFDMETDLSISSPDFSRYEVGVSGAEYLIARTGSIFINSRKAGGRRLTVLPPVHIVLARQSQLVASLDDVLKKISKTDNDWSYATFITGPSRTSDIEKKLVLGAHGPKRLITILLKN
jgi:L-lactate dehydrogenase complex protein LldG